MEDDCGGSSFVLSAFTFVRFPPIYKGGKTNKQKHVLCHFVITSSLGIIEAFFGLFCRKMPISKHLSISFKTFKYSYSNI